MAKIYGLFGSMTGKVADVVMATRNGEQIVRKYQPTVLNPKTEAQTAARAKLKLLSQLSAVVAPVIAMPRIGSVSARNRFLKENYSLAAYSEDTASVTLDSIQLTKSVVALPQVQAIRIVDPAPAIGAQFIYPAEAASLDVDRVVYSLFAKQNDGKLRYVTSSIATDASANNTWPVSNFPNLTGEVVLYAYGVRLNNEAAKVAFSNLTATTAEAVAKLIVSRTLTESDVTLTETRGFTLPATV